MFDDQRKLEIVNQDAKHLLELWKFYQKADDSEKEEIALFILNRIRWMIEITERDNEK